MIIRFNANKENSPLLRLPLEIRDMIWKYALGGKTFEVLGGYYIASVRKYIRRATLKPSPESPAEGTALLRTCKQIFLETEPYIITLGSLLCEDPRMLVSAVNKLKAHQRKQVSLVRMSILSMQVYSIAVATSD